MSFHDKTALITGAASGIGAATARLLKERHIGTLLLLDIRAGALAQAAQELACSGAVPRVFHRAVDIMDRAALQTTIGSICPAPGKIDVLIHCAASGDSNEPEDIDTWRHVFNVNVNGAYHVALEALKFMPEGGRIVNVASAFGRAGHARSTAYCTSKHALLGFTKSLALDLAPRRITVNAVLPAYVDTPMYREMLEREASRAHMPMDAFLELAKRKVPLNRFLEGREVAEMIAFLVSEEAAGITAQSYVIDGGSLCGA